MVANIRRLITLIKRLELRVAALEEAAKPAKPIQKNEIITESKKGAK